MAAGECRTCGHPLGWHYEGACPKNGDGTPAYRVTKGDRVKSSLGRLREPKPKGFKPPRRNAKYTA
jgi:hypothetical protein